MITIRDVLIYFSLKYQGSQREVMNALKNKEPVVQDHVMLKVQEIKSKVLTILDDEYPNYFKDYYQPPLVLYYYGDISLLKKKPILAVVGSRNNSVYGQKVTKELINKLCFKKNITIVSGMARGIDTIAHSEALEQGAGTIAILGSGIDYPYPKENEWLYQKIKKQGLVISEYPSDLKPNKMNFPVRNRLIAFACDKLLITEAKKNSGSLITLRFVLDVGKDVLCVPDQIFSDSECNRLIQQGAKMINSVDDLMEEFENF